MTVLHLQFLLTDRLIDPDPDAEGRGGSSGSLGGKNQQCQLNAFSNEWITFSFCGVQEPAVPLLLWRATMWKWCRETRRGRAESSTPLIFTAGAGLSSSHWNRASLQPDVPVPAVASQLQLQLLHNTKHFAIREKSTSIRYVTNCDSLIAFSVILLMEK